MEHINNENSPPTSWISTLLACGGAITILMFNGVVEAHSSVLLPQLEEKDSFIKVTAEEGTWIASLGIVASPLSAIICGPIADYLGRKIVIQCYFLISAVGYSIIAAAKNVFHLYVGRIICSFGVGFEVGGIIYIAEVCTKEQRSIFLSTTVPMFTGGILFTYLVGINLPWTVASAVFALSCLFLFLYECFTPESPPWLVKKGRIDEAKKSFRRLGRSEEYLDEEIKILKMSCESESKQNIEWRTFLEPTVWKPFLIIGLFHFLQAATGIYNLLYYTVNFIEQLGTDFNAVQVSLFLAIGRFVTTSTIGLFSMVKVKRKTATTLSALFMGIPLLIAAVYEYIYRDTGLTDRNYTWIPVASVFTSVIISTAGVMHLPWLMSGEVFPLHVRGAMSGAVFFIGSFSMFAFLKSYLFFIETFRISGLLLFYSIASFLTALFGIFILTETQNKSLLEIENSYAKKSERLNPKKPDV